MRKITLSLMIGILISIIFVYAETQPAMECPDGSTGTQIFWDDFEDGTINSTLWKITTGVTETNGYMEFDDYGGSWAKYAITKINKSMKNTILLVNASVSSDNGAGIYFGLNPLNAEITGNGTFVSRDSCGDSGIQTKVHNATNTMWAATLKASGGGGDTNGCTGGWFVYRMHIFEDTGGNWSRADSGFSWSSNATSYEHPNSNFAQEIYNFKLTGAYVVWKADWVLWYSCGAAGDVTPPSISYINCTSCVTDATPEQAPYQTEDTIVSFEINTSEDAVCAIADADLSYTDMINGNPARNCTISNGIEHSCVLQQSDALILNETDYVYIGCKDNSGNENTKSSSGPLETSIQQVETKGKNAIQAGIGSSVIGGATIYTDQQVYLRDSNNNQITGTFDKLAVYGNQRWAFNYLTSIELFTSGLFNIVPAFYASEYAEMTFQQVNDSVRAFINSTKS